MKRFARDLALPAAARQLRALDRRNIVGDDPGVTHAGTAMVDWLARSQDACQDGAVSEGFSLLDGWTGASTFSTAAALTRFHYAGSTDRVDKAAAWLTSQLGNNGEFASCPEALLALINLDLAASDRDFVINGAKGLQASQSVEGAWPNPTPSLGLSDDPCSYTVACVRALVAVERVFPNAGFDDSALRGAIWLLGKIRRNGWMEGCNEHDQGAADVTAFGGVLQALNDVYGMTGDIRFLDTALLISWALVAVQMNDGRLAGRFDALWQPAVPWADLAGTARVAACWLQLYEETGESAFAEAGRKANRFIRRTLILDDSVEVRGGVRAIYPVHQGDRRYLISSVATALALQSQEMERSMDIKTEVSRST
ncbi:MAG: hypothetical protein ACE363_10735 [Alphaproteobacteria bacterium]